MVSSDAQPSPDGSLPPLASAFQLAYVLVFLFTLVRAGQFAISGSGGQFEELLKYPRADRLAVSVCTIIFILSVLANMARLYITLEMMESEGEHFVELKECLEKKGYFLQSVELALRIAMIFVITFKIVEPWNNVPDVINFLLSMYLSMLAWSAFVVIFVIDGDPYTRSRYFWVLNWLATKVSVGRRYYLFAGVLGVFQAILLHWSFERRSTGIIFLSMTIAVCTSFYGLALALDMYKNMRVYLNFISKKFGKKHIVCALLMTISLLLLSHYLSAHADQSATSQYPCSRECNAPLKVRKP